MTKYFKLFIITLIIINIASANNSGENVSNMRCDVNATVSHIPLLTYKEKGNYLNPTIEQIGPSHNVPIGRVILGWNHGNFLIKKLQDNTYSTHSVSSGGNAFGITANDESSSPYSEDTLNIVFGLYVRDGLDLDTGEDFELEKTIPYELAKGEKGYDYSLPLGGIPVQGSFGGPSGGGSYIQYIIYGLNVKCQKVLND